MNYFGKKIRSVISDKVELEILLLKQAILAALRSGCTVQYKDRYMLYKYNDMWVINKTPDLSANVTFKELQDGQAVDSFIDLFITEDNCNVASVSFHLAGGKGLFWKVIRRSCNIEDLYDYVHFQHRMSLLIHEFSSEETDSSTTTSDPVPG